MNKPRTQDAHLSRVRPLQLARTALLVVDAQNMVIEDEEATSNAYFMNEAQNRALPNLRRLIDGCRTYGVEVIYTVIENLTMDGRDRSLDYKLSGFFIAKGSREAQVIDVVAPRDDEIVLPKTSSSFFNSTNIDYLLRNIGIDTVAVTGFLTDQCVDHTLRDSADRGYYPICIADACATHTAERHAAALKLFGGYCRTTNTDAFLNELRQASEQS